jgi:hypothetical protein
LSAVRLGAMQLGGMPWVGMCRVGMRARRMPCEMYADGMHPVGRVMTLLRLVECRYPCGLSYDT